MCVHEMRARQHERGTVLYYHKTVAVVNAHSARVTDGVPINNTLSAVHLMHTGYVHHDRAMTAGGGGGGVVPLLLLLLPVS